MSGCIPPKPLPERLNPAWNVPDDETCFSYWERFDVPAHIRRHSQLVADVATGVAQAAADAGHDVGVQTVRASALLHDLAKAYTIAHGGNHSQIGAAWVLELIGNPLIASGVLHHVHWPFELDINHHFLVLTVLYGDKRVCHDKVVDVSARFEDLIERYAHNTTVHSLLAQNLEQTLELERRLSALTGVDLSACVVDCGRLVQRT